MKYVQLICLFGLMFCVQLGSAQTSDKIYEITITTIDKDGDRKVKELVIEGEELSQEEIDELVNGQLDGSENEVDVNVNVNVTDKGNNRDEKTKTITKIIKKRTNLNDEEKIIIDETDMEIEVINDRVYINGEEVKEGEFGDKKVRILKFDEGEDVFMEEALEDVLNEEGIEIGKNEKIYFIETEESNEGIAFLGVTVGSSKDGGVSITGVVEGTSAEKMGLKKGDILMSIDGHKVIGYSSLSKTIKSYIPGEKVKLVYTRNGETKEAQVALSDYQKYSTDAVARAERGPHGKKRMHGHRKAGPAKASLGVKVKMIEEHIVIAQVIDQSAAQKAGLQLGDRILKVNKAKMLTMDQFYHTVKAYKIGDELNFKIERDGKKKNIQATLEQMKPRGKRYKKNKSSRTERIIIKDGNSVQNRADREAGGAIRLTDFELSPNPSPGKINVSFEMDRLAEGETFVVRIISLEGKVIEEKVIDSLDGVYSAEYDLVDSPEGIYLFQIEKQAQTFTKRFVIGRK